MSEVAEKAAEVVAENVEDAVDGVVDVIEVVRNNPMVLAGCATLGAALGVVGGYFLARKILQAEFNEALREEIERTRDFYAGAHKVDDEGNAKTPMDVLKDRHPEAAVAAEALREYQGMGGAENPYEDDQDETQIKKIEKATVRSISLETEVAPEKGVHPIESVSERAINVFSDDTFDLEHEMKYRTSTAPYIITHDEYFENDKDWEQSQLVYFAEDDTLVDEKNDPIREVDKMIGDDHLVRFGSGSKDRNVVYICNERLEMLFEVTRSTGSYVKEVLGLDESDGSLKHSDQRDRRRDFRRGEG